MGSFEKEGYKFYDGFFNEPVMHIEDSNAKQQFEYLKINNIKNVSLSKSLSDFSFLKELDFVEEVYISSNINPEDLYNLKKLKRIITNVTKNKPSINYSKFTHLEYLSIDWYDAFPDLSHNKSLKELVIWKYKPKSKSLEELKLPKGLEKLKITESNIEDLAGVDLKNLLQFESHYCRSLRSLNGLKEFVPSLKVLILDYCKNLVQYNEIQYGLKLEKIILGDCGDLPTIKWLKSLKNVEHFSFYNTKLVDGDTSPCSGIKYVSFKNARHYNLKIEEFRT